MPRWIVHFETRVDLANSELQHLISSIHAVAQLVTDFPLPPTAQQRLNSLNIIRAVRGTTGIEGANLTEGEVEEILKHPDSSVLPSSRHREEEEARNATRVMQWVAATSARIVSEELVKELHRMTTAGIDYQNNVPGVYRSHPVNAGDFLPPETNDEIKALMAELVRWLSTGERANWDVLVKAVIAHFYVVSVHPFGDGNGRTARAVESFVLYQGGINVRGFYSLANYYYQNRDQYIEMLDRVRFETNGDLTPFVLFALRGLNSELEVVRQEVIRESKRIAFRDFAQQAIFRSEAPARAAIAYRMFLLVTGMPEEGITQPQLIAVARRAVPAYSKVNERTIRRDISRLKELQLIEGIDNLLRPAIDIMDVFTRDLISSLMQPTGDTGMKAEE